MKGIGFDGQRMSERLCCVFGCTNIVLCRMRCQQHYVQLRRYELSGRAAELEKVEPTRPHWEWKGDSEWLASRLERDDLDLENK
jgi:hypothetical protein